MAFFAHLFDSNEQVTFTGTESMVYKCLTKTEEDDDGNDTDQPDFRFFPLSSMGQGDVDIDMDGETHTVGILLVSTQQAFSVASSIV